LEPPVDAEPVEAAAVAVVVPLARQLPRHGSTVPAKALKSSVAEVAPAAAVVVAPVVRIRSPNSLVDPKRSRSFYVRAARRPSLVAVVAPVKSVNGFPRSAAAVVLAAAGAVAAVEAAAQDRSRLRETISSP